VETSETLAVQEANFIVQARSGNSQSSRQLSAVNYQPSVNQLIDYRLIDLWPQSSAVHSGQIITQHLAWLKADG
jgi:hypothetical protein